MIRKSAIAFFILTTLQSRAGEIKYPVSSIPANLRKDAHVVKRMEEKEVEIVSPKEVRIHYKYALTILDEKGEDYAEFTEQYDKLQHVLSIEGALYDALGNLVKKVKTKDMEDRSSVEGLMDDNRLKKYAFYYRNFPYTVEFECSLKLDHSFWLPGWYPQEFAGLSVEKSIFTVSMPQDYVLRYKHLNFNGQPLAATDKNKKTLTWKIEQLPSVKKEFAAPRWQEITPMVSIAPAEFQLDEYKGDMTTWKDFGKFIYELTKNRDELPDDVKQKVAQLTAGLKTDVEKIQVLYRFLQQNTRYISIQLGIGGWQPFEASFVSKKGYGDCKALSNFMYSLLKAANIKSYYTLIKSGNYNYYMNEDFPSNQFDHVIVCVPLQKDTMWLECTSQTVAPGYMGEFTGNRKALLIDENGGTLVSTPRYTIRENLLVRKVWAKLDPDGTLGMKVHTRYGGTQQDELSMMINQLSKDKVQKILQEELELSTYSVDDFKYEETRAVLPELNEELSVTVSNYATISGKRIFITPNILNRNGTRLEQEEDRKVDFVFYSEYRDEDSCEIEIPDGYQLEAKPADVTLKTKFGTYTCSSKLEGNKISYHRVLEKYAGRFPVKDQAALIQFLGDIYTADRSRMVLVKKS
jgi:hypothetical protein